MISNNLLKKVAFKHDFSALSKKYRDAFKYYGYTDSALTRVAEQNMQIYPMPILKNSRTLSKQSSLPRLPVPSLESSIQRYLVAVKPHLNNEEFENTKKLALDFIKKDGPGEKLQRLLVEKSKSTDNWLAQWWLDKIYLEPRYSVMINVSPGKVYPKESYRTLDEQLLFATKYICGFLEFQTFLGEQKLPTDKLGDAFLCMDQYYKLFGTCRVPKRKIDDLKVMQAFNIDYTKCNHIVVMYHNKAFKLEIIDPKTGLNRTPGQIYKNLRAIVASSTQPDEYGLGLFTAENRDVWADVYSKLSQNAQNQKNMALIQNSFFVLCLDEPTRSVNKPNMDERSLAGEHVLHGNGVFTANRWFDKTVQVVIGGNGQWGVNFEHTVSDALPHAYMNDFIYKFIRKHNSELIESSNESSGDNLMRELKFDVSSELKNQWIKSRDTIKKEIDNMELYILHFDSFGKDFAKSQKLSPDAFVQISLQLAFYRMHSKLGNAYESGSLRKYHLGRTEIIRAATSDTLDFLHKMCSDSTSTDEKAAALRHAINAHRNYTTNVLNFNAFDRHLLGLKLIAVENGFDLPGIFNDTATKRLSHYYISSSQVSSQFEAVTCFGPAVEDGYGVCYNIMEKKIIVSLSAFNSCAKTSARGFAQHVERAFLDCQRVLSKINSKL